MMKFYLDTNVYDYIAKHGEVGKLKEFFNRGSIDIEVSLNTICEVARIPDEKIRTRCFQTIWFLGSIYLKYPESYLEAMEITSEMIRCRPNWMYSKSTDDSKIPIFLNNYRLIMKSFKRNGYLQMNKSFDEYVSLSERAIRLGNPNDKEVRHAFSKYKKLYVASNDPEIQALLSPLTEMESFWRGRSSMAWKQALLGDPSMRDYKDWLFPYLRKKAIEITEWESFWLSDLNPNNTPRTYIRGLTEYFQLKFSITHGNMADSNHSVNLIDNVLFLTCDKTFFKVLTRVYENTIFRIAQPIFIDRNRNAANDEITHAINLALKNVTHS